MITRLLFVLGSLAGWVVEFFRVHQQSPLSTSTSYGLPALVGLHGRMGVGKDTAADALEARGFKRVSFAAPLKAVALACNPLVWHDGSVVRLASIVDALGWDAAKQNPEVRRFLQALGTDGVRKHCGEKTWTAVATRQIRAHMAAGDPVVVTDVRFDNEAQAIRDIGGRVLMIVRPDHDPAEGVGNHTSEAGIAGHLLSGVIVNDSDIPALHSAIVSAVERTYSQN